MRDIICPWGLFNNICPFTVSPHLAIRFLHHLPLPLPIPFSVLCCLPYTLPILRSLPLSSPVLTALYVFLTLALNIVTVITRTDTSTARRFGIHQLFTIIIYLVHLIPIQWDVEQKVAWIVQSAAWSLNLYAQITTIVPRGMFASEYNFARAGFLQIGATNLNPEITRVCSLPIVDLVTGLFKHLTNK